MICCECSHLSSCREPRHIRHEPTMAHVNMTDSVWLHRRQLRCVLVVGPALAEKSNALPAFSLVDGREALGDVPRHDLTVDRPAYNNLAVHQVGNVRTSPMFRSIVCEYGKYQSRGLMQVGNNFQRTGCLQHREPVPLVA